MDIVGAALARQMRPLHLSGVFARYLPSCRRSSGRIPLTFFEPESLRQCEANEPSGTVVAVRGSDSFSLHAVGFYDPTELCVEVFHWGAHDEPFPVTDVRFFHGLIMAAIRRRAPHLADMRQRRGGAHIPTDTVVRLFHGAPDGIPSLYITLFGTRVQIVATSTSAEQLVPLVELLMGKVFEATDCYVYSPSEVFHVADRVAGSASRSKLLDSSGSPTSADSELGVDSLASSTSVSAAGFWNTFVENGVCYAAPSQGMMPSINGVNQLLSLTTYPLFPVHHAASRVSFFAKECEGKTVLLMGLEEGVAGMLMNCLGYARKVIVATDSTYMQTLVKERVLFHFSEAAFSQILFIRRADLRPEVFVDDLGVEFVGICGLSVGSSLVSSRVEMKGATLLMDMIEHALECMQAGKGALRGTLAIQCGANSLGVHRPSRGGLIKGPTSFLKGGLSEAVEIIHRKSPSKSRVALVQREALTRSPQFPHDRTLLDEADKIGIERWEPAFCDVLLDVVEEDCAVSHTAALEARKQ